MQQQPSSRQENRDALAPLLQHARVIVEQCEIVHVAQIAARAQYLFHKVIERIEHHVGEELAGQVADRQPAPSLVRGKQVIPRKVGIDGLLRVGAVRQAPC